MFKKIAFDIDGVLQDFQEYVVRKFLVHYYQVTGKKYNGCIDYTQYDAHDLFPDCKDPRIVAAVVDEAFAEYVKEDPFSPHVRELFLYLKTKKIEVHIVTARHAQGSLSLEEMERLTKERFQKEDIPVAEFHVGFEDKLSVIRGAGIECIVEDSPENIIQLSEEIPVLIYTRPYNKLVMGSNMYHIESFYPVDFYKKLEYICNHRNYLGSKPEYQEKPALDVSMIDGRAYVNIHNIPKNDPIFIVPLSGKNEESLLNRWKAYCNGKCEVIDLYEMDRPFEDITNAVIRETRWFRCKGGNIQQTNETSSDTYQMRSEVLLDILKIVQERRQRCIIFGPQIMQLERKYLQELKDCVFIFPHVTGSMRNIFTSSIYKKDYDIAKLIEDLDEISMDTRKYKIIAGTDPDHLEGYINREYYTIDGYDTVELKSNEKPYHPEDLNYALTPDTYLIGDCHLTKKDKEKTQMILDNINNTVGLDDTLLFLGDFDGKFGADKETIQKFIQRIRCRNLYMLVGNNDGYPLRDYIAMGFRGISDVAVMGEGSSSKVIISHCPVAISGSEINLHGHLHGGRIYWNMDATNHLDIYNEDFMPIKIRDCLRILELGYYRATSVNVGY